MLPSCYVTTFASPLSLFAYALSLNFPITIPPISYLMLSVRVGGSVNFLFCRHFPLYADNFHHPCFLFFFFPAGLAQNFEKFESIKESSRKNGSFDLNSPEEHKK